MVDGGTPANPSQEELAKLAYLISLNRSCLQLHEMVHWFAAEAQMIAAQGLKCSRA